MLYYTSQRTIIFTRIDQTVVLEAVANERNYEAVLRTCEALGIQYVHIIRPRTLQYKVQPASNTYMSSRITRSAAKYLSIRWYEGVAECTRELRKEGYEIWATDLNAKSQNLLSLMQQYDDAETQKSLSPPQLSHAPTLNGYSSLENISARNLTRHGPHKKERLRRLLKFPQKLAIALGSEAGGISEELRSWSDKTIFYPMHGFTESLNLGVASGIVLSSILSRRPSLRGTLSEAETRVVRSRWYMGLARTARQQALFPQFIQKPPPPLPSPQAFASSGERIRVSRRFKPRAAPAILSSTITNYSAALGRETGGARGPANPIISRPRPDSTGSGEKGACDDDGLEQRDYSLSRINQSPSLMPTDSYVKRAPQANFHLPSLPMKDLSFRVSYAQTPTPEPQTGSLEDANAKKDSEILRDEKASMEMEFSSPKTTAAYYAEALRRPNIDAYGDPVPAPTRRPHPADFMANKHLFGEVKQDTRPRSLKDIAQVLGAIRDGLGP